MKYLTNRTAIIFLDLDWLNHYNTIAYDWETDSIFAIRPKEYFLLKYLSDNNGIDEEELMNYYAESLIDPEEILSSIKDLISKNLITSSND